MGSPFDKIAGKLTSTYDRAAGTGATDFGSPSLQFIEGPGGYLFPLYTDPETGDVILAPKYNPNTGDGSAGGGSANDMLAAAQAALTGYLSAQAQADARKLAAFEQAMNIAQFALPAGATNFPGYGPGESAHAFAGAIGMPSYTPPPMTPTQFNPSAINTPGQVSPEIMAMIGNITGAGASGRKATP